jgi:hypothetical protein
MPALLRPVNDCFKGNVREINFHIEMESFHKMATVVSLTDLALKIDA